MNGVQIIKSAHLSFDPLNDKIIDFLISKNSETAEYDFKYLVNLLKNSDFVKIVEDIFAMSNYGARALRQDPPCRNFKSNYNNESRAFYLTHEMSTSLSSDL